MLRRSPSIGLEAASWSSATVGPKRMQYDGRHRARPLLQSLGLTALLASIALLVATAIAISAPNYPELTGRIVDNAGLLSAEDRAAIETELQALEATSTDQVAVVTVPSLDGYAIEDYSIGLARKWAIGQKDKDNGIVLLVAPNERKVRIEVGRRLEPIMTDTMAQLIIENAILSRFRRGDMSGGVREGVRDIKSVLLGDSEEVKRRARPSPNQPDDLTAMIPLLIFLAIFAFIMWNMYKEQERERIYEQSLTPEERKTRARQRRARQGPFVIVPGNSGSWGGGGGGWSGGGGGFGGGGSSGSW